MAEVHMVIEVVDGVAFTKLGQFRTFGWTESADLEPSIPASLMMYSARRLNVYLSLIMNGFRSDLQPPSTTSSPSRWFTPLGKVNAYFGYNLRIVLNSTTKCTHLRSNEWQSVRLKKNSNTI